MSLNFPRPAAPNPASDPAQHFNKRPFLIEVQQNRPRPHAAFVPSSSLKLTEDLRTSGLLHALPPEELKSLVYLLTFLSPEGHCSVSLPILTSAMRLASFQVKARMHRLAQFRFQDQNLIIEVGHESGLYTYSLHPHLLAYEHLTVSSPHLTPPFPPRATRRQVVAHSRQEHARPRAEVERIVAEQLGEDVTETDLHRKLRLRLENVGLTSEQAREVLQGHDTDRIAQQLDWLPFRNAKNPTGYLLAAIDGNYQEPRSIRDHRFVLEEKYGGDVRDDETASAINEDGDEVPELIERAPVENEVALNNNADSEIKSDSNAHPSVQSLEELSVGNAEISLSPEE